MADMTPEERANAVVANATGPINLKRYACDVLEECIAAAISSAVAEECEKVAESLFLKWSKETARLIAVAVAEEREACAAEVESFTTKGHAANPENPPGWYLGYEAALGDSSAAIRARGQ